MPSPFHVPSSAYAGLGLEPAVLPRGVQPPEIAGYPTKAAIVVCSRSGDINCHSAPGISAWFDLVARHIGSGQIISRAKYPNRPARTALMCPANSATYGDTWDNRFGVNYVVNNRCGMGWSKGQFSRRRELIF